MRGVCNLDANNIGETNMTVSSNDYCNFLNECDSLISTIKTYIEFADRLSSYLCVDENDEDGNIVRLVPMSKEHFQTLKSTANKISSYADRLSSLLSKQEQNISSLYR